MSEITFPYYKWDEDEEEDIHNPRIILRDIRTKFYEEVEEISIPDPIMIEKQILELKQKLEAIEHKLEQKQSKIKKTMTKGEIVYKKLQSKIEKKYTDKVVAIDVDNKKVVGIGNSIEEAYDDAVSNSDKKRFYFKKVGQKYTSSV